MASQTSIIKTPKHQYAWALKTREAVVYLISTNIHTLIHFYIPSADGSLKTIYSLQNCDFCKRNCCQLFTSLREHIITTFRQIK